MTQVATQVPSPRGGRLTRLLIRTLAYGRAAALKRQFKIVDQALSEISVAQRHEVMSQFLKDMSQASKTTMPQFFGSRELDRYQPWGNATDEAIDYVRGNNLPLRIHGLARWLVVAYFETRQTNYDDLAELHRQLQRRIRLFKESIKPADMLAIQQRLRQAA